MQLGYIDRSLRLPDSDAFRVVADAGLEGMEIGIYGDYPNDRFWDRDARQDLARRAKDHGLTLASVILSTHGRIDFPEDDQQRALCREMARATVEACAELTIPVMMIPCFKKHHYTTVLQMERAIDDMRDLVPRAEALGVMVGLETLLPGATNQYLIETIDSPNVTIYYDAANTLNYGWDPYAELPRLAPVICRHHIKPSSGTVGWRPSAPGERPPGHRLRLDEGTFDVTAWVTAVQASGYDGWLMLETSPVGDDHVAEAHHNARVLREMVR